MERILHYEIKASDDSPTVACFLKRQGYSSANLTDLKKMPESILKNGVWEYMRSLLATGDILTVHIQENESSPNIPPVELPLSIIYEDEDILVVNKPAGMPIHPSDVQVLRMLLLPVLSQDTLSSFYYEEHEPDDL